MVLTLLLNSVVDHIINDHETRKSRGFGFVTFKDEQAMKDAIEGMNGQSLDGRNITVNKSQSRGSGGSGARREGGSGGGYDRRDGGYGGGGGGYSHRDGGYDSGGYGGGDRYSRGGDDGSWRSSSRIKLRDLKLPASR
ncbi:PREDICTED: glycine-rich RNA-binding protein GRP1A-like [Ipomoea nil]|uniref:glycine-rich RNA-binding protein GRP1A-like n=1 Tax=Ipomoea nil TaxID=35883 RepID=UPI000900DC5E|nr:PREDICTED: glycine-rich RNA-binding protein GRP1A-like [Ipomoea nil]